MREALAAWREKLTYAENPGETGRCRIEIKRLERLEEEILNALLKLEDGKNSADAPSGFDRRDVHAKAAPNVHAKAAPKCVLFISSSPSGKTPLDFGAEFSSIETAMNEATRRDDFRLEMGVRVSVSKLPDLLAKHQPAIIHITMHASKSEGLYFEDDDGQERPLADHELRDIFEWQSKKHVPDLVVLSACNSLASARAIAPFARHVIGTQDFFPEPVAVRYAGSLYRMLFNGQEVAYAHEAACLALKQENRLKAGQESLSTPIHRIPVLINGQ